MYVIKIGEFYLTSTGDFSLCQADAVRIANGNLARLDTSSAPRLVRLRPHGSLPQTAGNDASVPPAQPQ